MAAITVEELLRNAKDVKIELASLRSDFKSYQRDIKEEKVDEYASNWNDIACGQILVSDRGERPADSETPGGLWIINGQHRVKAAMKLGKTRLPAKVIDLTNEPDPAALEAEYRLMTNNQTTDTALEKFKAKLAAGHEEALAIVGILAEYDTEINMKPNGEFGINAVATVEQIYRLDEGSLLRETLGIIRDVWEHVGGKQAGSDMMKGLCWFIDKHADESDRQRLVVRLRSLGIETLESRARTQALSTGGSLWVNYYKAIIATYNEQLRDKNKLQWKLRGAAGLGKARSY